MLFGGVHPVDGDRRVSPTAEDVSMIFPGLEVCVYAAPMSDRHRRVLPEQIDAIVARADPKASSPASFMNKGDGPHLADGSAAR